MFQEQINSHSEPPHYTAPTGCRRFSVCFPPNLQTLGGMDLLCHSSPPSLHPEISSEVVLFSSCVYPVYVRSLLCTPQPLWLWDVPLMDSFLILVSTHAALPARSSSPPLVHCMDDWPQVFKLIHLHWLLSSHVHLSTCLSHSRLFCLDCTNFHSSSLQIIPPPAHYSHYKSQCRHRDSCLPPSVCWPEWAQGRSLM